MAATTLDELLAQAEREDAEMLNLHRDLVQSNPPDNKAHRRKPEPNNMGKKGKVKPPVGDFKEEGTTQLEILNIIDSKEPEMNDNKQIWEDDAEEEKEEGNLPEMAKDQSGRERGNRKGKRDKKDKGKGKGKGK